MITAQPFAIHLIEQEAISRRAINGTMGNFHDLAKACHSHLQRICSATTKTYPHLTSLTIVEEKSPSTLIPLLKQWQIKLQQSDLNHPIRKDANNVCRDLLRAFNERKWKCYKKLGYSAYTCLNAHEVLGIMTQCPEQAKNRLEISLLLTHPDQLACTVTRIRGIGSRLIQHAEDQARKHRLSCVRVLATASSVPFYERMGFLFDFDKMCQYIEDGEIIWHLYKPLASVCAQEIDDNMLRSDEGSNLSLKAATAPSKHES